MYVFLLRIYLKLLIIYMSIIQVDCNAYWNNYFLFFVDFLKSNFYIQTILTKCYLAIPAPFYFSFLAVIKVFAIKINSQNSITVSETYPLKMPTLQKVTKLITSDLCNLNLKSLLNYQ